MKLVNKILAGMAGSVLMVAASASMAADIPVMVPPMAPPVIVVPPPAGFDWQGVYVGGVLSLGVDPSPFAVGIIGVGGQVGFNIVRGSLLFGPVLRAGVVFGPNALVVSGGARAGVLVGAEDRLLIYGGAALAYIPAGPGLVTTAGGGVEFGIGERLSIYGETRVLISGGVGCCIVMTGVNLHF